MSTVPVQPIDEVAWEEAFDAYCNGKTGTSHKRGAEIIARFRVRQTQDALVRETVLRMQINELEADKARLEFIINTLNRVGTSGIGSVIRWGYPGLDRGDIDEAMRRAAP